MPWITCIYYLNLHVIIPSISLTTTHWFTKGQKRFHHWLVGLIVKSINIYYLLWCRWYYLQVYHLLRLNELYTALETAQNVFSCTFFFFPDFPLILSSQKQHCRFSFQLILSHPIHDTSTNNLFYGLDFNLTPLLNENDNQPTQDAKICPPPKETSTTQGCKGCKGTTQSHQA